MKILFASSGSGSRGGGEMYLVYLARALAGLGHEATLWASEHPRMDEVAEAFAKIGKVSRSAHRNMYDRRGRSLTASLDFRGARRWAQEWKALTPDVIHINKQNLEDALDLLRASHSVQTPSVCTVHLTQSAGILGARLPWLRDAVSHRAMAAYGQPFVTVLEDRRRELSTFLGSNARLRTVITGIPLFDLQRREALRMHKRAELGLTGEQLLVIGVGRMVPQKRPLYFLEIAEQTIRARPDVNFLWIGDGPLQNDWDRRILERGLAGRVTGAGWQGDVGPFFAAADILLHVAEFEGLPLALLEAMSAGLPCAITENLRAEMPFLASAGMLAAAPGEAWISALGDRSRLREHGEAARRLVETEFSFERMAREYEAIYHEAETLRRSA